jgi:hypothetical protein
VKHRFIGAKYHFIDARRHFIFIDARRHFIPERTPL